MKKEKYETNAEKAYCSESLSSKQEYIQKVIGNCETILATLECCEDDAYE